MTQRMYLYLSLRVRPHRRIDGTMNRRLLIVLMAAVAAIFLAQFGAATTIAGLAILTFCVIGAVTSREEKEHDADIQP